MAIGVRTETHIEVHKFYAGTVAGAAFLALALQGFLPKYFAQADLLELPLLVTIYFALSRRNTASGLLLGMVIGVLQDGISHTPIGLYGIAKTLVGYVASSIGSRINVEHPFSRLGLTFAFFHFHRAVVVFTRRLLLAQPEPFFSPHLLLASVVCAVTAVILFPLLDHLRKPS